MKCLECGVEFDESVKEDPDWRDFWPLFCSSRCFYNKLAQGISDDVDRHLLEELENLSFKVPLRL